MIQVFRNEQPTGRNSTVGVTLIATIVKHTLTIQQCHHTERLNFVKAENITIALVMSATKSTEFVTIVRRRMTLAQCEMMRKKAHKMVQDVKKYLKRKGVK